MKIKRPIKSILYFIAAVVFSCSAFASSVALTSHEDLSPGDIYFAITGTDPVDLPMLVNKFVLIDDVDFHLRDKFLENASVVYVDVNKLKNDYDGKIERQIDHAYDLGASIYFDVFDDQELVVFRADYLQNKYGTRYGEQRFVTVFNREVINQRYEDKPFYELAALNARGVSCGGYPKEVSIFLQFMGFIPVVGPVFSLGDVIGSAVDSLAQCPENIKKEMTESEVNFLITTALVNQLSGNVKDFFNTANEKHLPKNQRDPSVRVENIYPTGVQVSGNGVTAGFPAINLLAKHASVMFELNKIDYVYHQNKYKLEPKEQETARKRIMSRLSALAGRFGTTTEKHHGDIRDLGLNPGQRKVRVVERIRVGDTPPCKWIEYPPPRPGGYWFCPPAPQIKYKRYEVRIGHKVYEGGYYNRSQYDQAMRGGKEFRKRKVLDFATVPDDVIRVVAKIRNFKKFLHNLGPVKANNLLPELDAINKVRVFSDNFSGTGISLAVGNYSSTDFGMSNDTISSVYVPYGLQATLFEHVLFGGKSIRYNSSSILAPELNNKVSSIKISKTKVLYKHLVSHLYPDNCIAYTTVDGFFAYTCNTNADQLWQMDEVGKLRNLKTNQCVTNDKKSIKMMHCNNTDNRQKWYWSHEGIRSKVSNACIDKSMSSNKVILYACHKKANQRWHHQSYRVGVIP